MTNTDDAVACVYAIVSNENHGDEEYAVVEMQLLNGYAPKLGDKLIPADSLAGLRAELLQYQNRVFELCCDVGELTVARDKPQSTLAAVGTLADELAIHPAGGEAGAIYANRIKSLIAEAGTSGVGDG